MNTVQSQFKIQFKTIDGRHMGFFVDKYELQGNNDLRLFHATLRAGQFERIATYEVIPETITVDGEKLV